jgi:hypothetical protein
MLKKILEWCEDYNAVQQELNSMGIFTHHLGTYVNKEMYTAYWEKYEDKKLAEGDQSSTKD